MVLSRFRNFALAVALLIAPAVANSQTYPSPTHQGITVRSLTGYVYCNGISQCTASTSIPLANFSGFGSGIAYAVAIAGNTPGGIALINGSITVGNCLKWSTTGIQDAGAACPGGSSSALASITGFGTGVETALTNTINSLTSGSYGVLTGALVGTSGANIPLMSTANAWGPAQTFNTTPIIAALPNLTTNVESTGVPGLDGASDMSPWFLFGSSTTLDNAVNPVLRVQRDNTYSNSIPITAVSGNGTTATFSYSELAIPVGHTINISGEQPWGYNGQCVVTASVQGTPSTSSCLNATSGSQTVAGTITDLTTLGVVNDLWALESTAPFASYYDWTFLSQMINQTAASKGNFPQNVAFNATATKQYKAGVDYATATFTGYTSGTTLTVTAIASGSISPSDILNGTGVTPGTAIYAQLTATGPYGGIGTYQLSISQTVASEALTTTAQISATWGSNIVCQDMTTIVDPMTSCVGLELDSYAVAGVGTDANRQRVNLQLVWGNSNSGAVGLGDHYGSSILFGGDDLSTMDDALFFGGFGTYGNIINLDGATITGNIIESPNFVLSGAGDITTYSTISIGNTGVYSFVVAGGVWFGSYSVNEPVAISALPGCDASYVGAHAMVNNGVNPAAYKTVVGTTGTAVWPVHCAYTGSAYNWYYD